MKLTEQVKILDNNIKTNKHLKIMFHLSAVFQK